MERTDPASGEDVKRMVQDLGTTIQRTLAESPQIAHCLNRIKSEGYEVSLVLEATILEAEEVFREQYQHNAPLMRFLGGIGVPLPRAFLITSEFAINGALREALDP